MSECDMGIDVLAQLLTAPISSHMTFIFTCPSINLITYNYSMMHTLLTYRYFSEIYIK